MPRFRTPGPGAYDMPTHLSVGGSPDRRPSASFASSTGRTNKSGSDASGDPGAYDLDHTGVHLGKKEPISARSRRSFNRDVNQGKGTFNSMSKRSSTPPARSARGGPGEHDYRHLYSCGHNGPQVTSSFMSAMPLGGHIRKSDTPGVGEYEPNDSERYHSKSLSKDGMSMFAGTLKRGGTAARSTTGEHIGPGSYELEHASINHAVVSKINPRLPGFGASSVRAGPGSRGGSPSPGAYDPAANETVFARSARSFNTSASTGDLHFGSNSTRRADVKRDANDPGATTVENPGVHTGKAESIASRSRRSFNRDVNQGKGTFNSMSKRSSTPPARSARGGPGEHDYRHLYSCGHNGPQVTSSFMSAMPLGGHIRKSDTPGVGEYEPNDSERYHSKSLSKDGMSMFAGTLKRGGTAARSTTGEHIGPGSYELEHASINHAVVSKINPRLPGFGSSSVRGEPDD